MIKILMMGMVVVLSAILNSVLHALEEIEETKIYVR